MESVIDFISQPWHWSVSGLMIVLVMFLLLYSGRRFGISSAFETMCSIGGAGKRISLFNFDWREQSWLLIFIAGTIIGGFISSTWLSNPEPIALSESTLAYLQEVGLSSPSPDQGAGLVPEEVFSWKSLGTWQGLLIMVGGGMLIGFGTRYARGCTSGHAISGLANLQLPSLIAVIGFFIGGLIMTYLILPGILKSML
jgi:uncharacterized membrane protein YedE/YeeE